MAEIYRLSRKNFEIRSLDSKARKKVGHLINIKKRSIRQEEEKLI